MNKKTILPVVVLTLICVVVAALLAVVNEFTAPTIEKAEEQKKYDAMRVVLDGDFAPADELLASAPDSVKAVFSVTRDGALAGHVVSLDVKGYASTISIIVGIDADGAVTKAVVTSQQESHGKAGMESYTDSFEGVTAENVASVDTFTGATISSTAIKSAIIDALSLVSGEISAPETSDKEEAKPSIKAPKNPRITARLAKELVNNEAANLVEVSLSSDAPENLIRLYHDANGIEGYVAYIVVPGAYVPVATEALVHVNLDGDIVAVDLLSWIVGHGVGAGDFADGFVGSDFWTVDGVELVTGATGTSVDFRGAVAEALEYITAKLARTDKMLLQLVDALVPNSKGFEEIEIADGAPSTLKRIYRETSGLGYVAYIVVPGAYVPVATEALVYLDTTGNVVDVNLMSWIVGHGVEPGDFADRFIGCNINSVSEVELVTAATGTSLDFRNALADAMAYIPTEFPTARVVGIAAVLVFVVAFTVILVVSKKRRAAK